MPAEPSEGAEIRFTVYGADAEENGSYYHLAHFPRNTLYSGLCWLPVSRVRNSSALFVSASSSRQATFSRTVGKRL